MSREAMKLEMVDDEGENRAVRMFLALYGGACGVTAEQMRKHLKMAGFDGAWPEWANDHDGHLTKAGAQLWIRHLFALAEQPAQKPVAWVDVKDTHHGPYEFHGKELLPVGKHELYTSPPAQRTWVGLTDEEVTKMPAWIYSPDQDGMTAEEGLEAFARAIEAKLKEKNT